MSKNTEHDLMMNNMTARQVQNAGTDSIGGEEKLILDLNP